MNWRPSIWHHNTGPEVAGISALFEFSESADRRRNQLMDALPNRTTLVVSYEHDHKADQRAAFQKVSDRIGIDGATASFDLHRFDLHPFDLCLFKLHLTSPFPVEQMIDHCDDFRDALDRTQYGSILDD